MTRKTPYFSVVIPTFNRCGAVGAAIRSVLTFLSSLDGEVVVVDDASTDDTIAMLHRTFGEQLRSGNVRLVQLGENRGVSEAKNVGYGSAEGEWVLFLDSDDALLADAANAVAEVLAAHQ